jgi:PAS domain S-box-containing protein
MWGQTNKKNTDRLIFFQSIVDNVPDMIFVKEAKELRFVLFNKAGEELLGYKREDMIGKNDYDFFPKEQAEFFINKDRTTLKNKVLVDILEEPIQTHYKGKRILHTKKIPILDKWGKPIYLLGISEDITKRKELEDELSEYAKNLQQKVDEQTKEIKEAYELEKKAKEELELLDKTKNQFLLTVQHHLRSPLSSMMGYSDLLRKNKFGKLPKEMLKVINMFQSSTASLIKIVNDFLDVTQFQLGKKQIILKPNVKVRTILEEIIKELKINAESKGIYLKFKKPKETYAIRADKEKLKLALFNIIDNAIKYTQDGGVNVEIMMKNNCVRVVVSDTGIGMPEENIVGLFDRIFERSEEAQKNFATGRGIGLYIASQIIKAHNGNIWVESKGVGEGTVFYIEIPIG